MQIDTYLTTDEAAAYLKLKERKLYELAATGAVPCSKVTGKWLFPRSALDRWVLAGLARPEGFIAQEPPPIIGGSHDPLLEWAARRSGAGLALMSEGSETGLDRLVRNEVAVAAIHLHDVDPELDANAAAVAARAGLHDAVVIGFARREQGLMIPAENPTGLGGLADAVARGSPIGIRQHGAGAQLLFEALLRRTGVTAEPVTVGPYPTGSDLAQAIRAGDAVCGIASRAVAEMHGLGFLPLMWERFDLVLRRRTYFEPPVQRLMSVALSPAFAEQAERLGGYDTSVRGQVRYNA